MGKAMGLAATGLLLACMPLGGCPRPPAQARQGGDESGRAALSPQPSSTPATAVEGSDSEPKLVLGRERLELTAAGVVPPAGRARRDPLFHTRIVRVTDRARDHYHDPAIKQEYARTDPENADGTLLILRGTEANWELYDGRRLRRMRSLRFEGDQEPEPRWHPTKPQILYYLSQMSLMQLDLRSGKRTRVRSFKRDFPRGDVVTTGTEGDASVDRRYFCLMVHLHSVPQAIFVYDRRTDRIVGRRSPVGAIDNLSMDMSGKHCVVGWESRAASAFSRDMKREVRLPAGVRGHSDLARTAAGKDVLVYQNVKTDWIAMADLDSGKETNLLRIPFQVNTDIGLHFSGNCTRAPGWVLVSTYGALHPPRGRRRSWMDRQIFMVQLAPSPLVWRIAQTHSITFVRPGDGQKAYFAEPFATINTRGTRVYWGSNWEGKDRNRIEAYAALLPEGWLDKLQAAARAR